MKGKIITYRSGSLIVASLRSPGGTAVMTGFGEYEAAARLHLAANLRDYGAQEIAAHESNAAVLRDAMAALEITVPA